MNCATYFGQRLISYSHISFLRDDGNVILHQKIFSKLPIQEKKHAPRGHEFHKGAGAKPGLNFYSATPSFTHSASDFCDHWQLLEDR